MNIREVMTRDPSCCIPSDTVATAAQTMRREDVGPVPVVSDHSEKRLVGILTDRDLAVRVVAEGRDPHNTRVDEVMTTNPVTCREDDDVMNVIRLMADHQIRRIPVVDSSSRLAGIVAQADIARHAEDAPVGEMVEEISQPYGEGHWTGEYDRADYARSMGNVAIGAMCFGAGIGLMYLMDPERGRRRRAVLRDKTTSALHTSSEAMQRTREDIRNRAQGVVASTRSRLKHEPVDDERLAARVRSKLGRYVSHPHAVQVQSREGHVTLSGAVLSDEAKSLLKAVRWIPGVQSVEDRMEHYDTPEGHPELQGGQHRTGSRMDFMQSHWAPSTRVLASAVGGGLLLYGLKSKGAVAKATASVGLGLLTRGIGNRELAELKDSLPGLGQVRRSVGL